MTHTDYKLNPEQFKILRVVGEGTFGEVRKCLKRDTKEIMAAKLPKNLASAKNEVRRFSIKNRNTCLAEQLFIMLNVKQLQLQAGANLVWDHKTCKSKTTANVLQIFTRNNVGML